MVLLIERNEEFMVGRASSGVARRAASKRLRTVSGAVDAAAVRGGNASASAQARGSTEDPIVRRCKQMSAIVAAAVAVACVSIGYGLWQTASSQSAVDQATKDSELVWVALRDVKAGEVLDAESFEARAVPGAFRSSTALPAEGNGSLEAVSGARALVDISAGSQLCGSYLVGAGSDGRLAAQLSEGMEAVSLSVDDETGVAGQVKPYDAVRVVSTEDDSSGSVDLRVLASAARVAAVGGDGYADSASYSAIVVEVLPDEADDIRQAQASGRVSVQLLASENAMVGGLSG